MRRASLAVTMAALLAGAGVAAADDTAASLAAQAETLAKAGKFEDAAAKFHAAHQLDPQPAYLCNIGVAYEHAKQLVKAQRYLGECLVRGTTLDAKFIAAVRNALGGVEDKLRAGDFTPVDLVVKPEGATIALDVFGPDERVVGSRVVWLPFGSHAVTVAAEGYAPQTFTVEASSRAQKQIQIALQPAGKSVEPVGVTKPAVPGGPTRPGVVPPGTPAADTRGTSHTPAIVATAATGALAIGAVISYLHARSIISGAEDLTVRSDFDARVATGRSWQHVSWGLGAAAGVGAVVSGYLFAHARHTVEVAPTSGGVAVSLAGRF